VDFTFGINFVQGDHPGSPGHFFTADLPEVIVQSIFNQQQRSAVMLNEWRHCFEPQGQLTEQQSKRFIMEMYDALEEVDDAFPNRITAAVTRHHQGRIDDILTSRPNTKSAWTLQLTTQGSGDYNCIRQRIQSKPGTALLFSPDAFYNYCRSDHSELWEHHWVYFPMQESWIELMQWPAVGPNIYALELGDDCSKKIQRLTFDLIDIRGDEDDFSEALKRSILEQILLRCRRKSPSTQQPLMDLRVNKCMDFIAHHLSNPLTIAELGEEVGLSSQRLSYLFKKQTGTTILSWRDEQRMIRAAQLLAQNNQSITTIADAIGYPDPLYFSRVFHQRVGISPRDYRNQHRTK